MSVAMARALIEAQTLAEAVQVDGDCLGVSDFTWQALADYRNATKVTDDRKH